MILLKRLKDSIKTAVVILRIFTIRKLNKVSYNVMPVCMNISRFLHMEIKSRQIRDGELKKKESMI